MRYSHGTLLLLLILACNSSQGMVSPDPGSHQRQNLIGPGLTDQETLSSNTIIVQFDQTVVDAAEDDRRRFSGLGKTGNTAALSAQLEARIPQLNALNQSLRKRTMRSVYRDHNRKQQLPSLSPDQQQRQQRHAATYLIEFDGEQNIVEVLNQYRNIPGVKHAQPNYLYTPDLIPNDPLYPNQYAHQLTQIEQAWDITVGDAAVVIAVIGTGIESSQPDLANQLWQNPGEINNNGIDDDGNGFIDDSRGWNFSSDNNNPEPTTPVPANPNSTNYHETWVAGVISAQSDNGEGVAGVAWNTKLMTLKVAYTSADVAAAIAYATDNGARVINMSFGNYDPPKYGTDSIVEDEIDAAFAAGVVLVATAGNSSQNLMRYPAALPNVLAIAATEANDGRAEFSNYGPWVTMAAPGSGIVTTGTGANYSNVNGTSFSAPYVAGVAALILSKDPSLTPTQVRLRLEYSVDVIDTDYYIGTGRINALRAVQLDNEPDHFAVIKTPTKNSFEDALVSITGTALGDNYQLEYRPLDSGSWQLLASGGQLIDAELGTFDMNPLPPGGYILRLTAFNGGLEKSSEITIYRTGGMMTGWPQSLGGAFINSPNIYDIDGDGDLEIILSNNNSETYIWQHDGTLLPGWPKTGSSYPFGSPAIGDIDGDGEMEILQGNYVGRVHAWHTNGSTVTGWPLNLAPLKVRGAIVLADLDDNGTMEAIGSSLYAGALDPRPNGFTHVWGANGTDFAGAWPAAIVSSRSSPVVGDIDGDGDLEIVNAEGMTIHAYHHDGSVVSGWPVVLWGLTTAVSNSPVLADLDGDNVAEIIYASTDTVISFRGDGTLLGGKTLPSEFTYTTMAVGDVNGDGQPEICIGGDDGKVYLFDNQLELMPGWPVSGNTSSDMQGCVIADIDSDNMHDVIIPSSDGFLYAWKFDGSVPEGLWPIPIGDVVNNSIPAVADLDRDGDVEIVVATEGGKVLIFDLDESDGDATGSWPMYQSSPANTGRHGDVYRLPVYPMEEGQSYGQFVVQDITVDLQATSGNYHLVVSDPSLGEVALYRGNTLQSSLSYDWTTIVSGTQPYLSYTFDFPGYFSITIRATDGLLIDLATIGDILFDGKLTLAVDSTQLGPLGDINDNGIVDLGDLLLLEQHLLQIRTLTSAQLSHGDLYPAGNGDDVINASDLLSLKKLVLGQQ